MRFITVLNEATRAEPLTIKYIDDYDFNKSYYDYIHQGQRMRLTEYQYKKKITNSKGMSVAAMKVLPVYSSKQDHPIDRGDTRLGIDAAQLNSLLQQSLDKIKALGFKEDGYLIYQKSTGAVIPTLLYRNIDTLDTFGGERQVMVKGKYPAPASFKEFPEYFLEVRTVLNKNIHKYGTDQIKLYSGNPIGVLRNHIDILLENRRQRFFLIELP